MRTLFALFLSFIMVSPALAEIEITEVTSPGGITAWLVPEPSIPFVSLEIRFKGGASLDDPGKRGATNLMAGLLEEGAGERDAQAFALATEELAASFSYGAGDDSVSVSARFLSENRDEAVALLRDTLVAPRFDADAMERVRAQVLSGLRSDATDPDAIVGRAFEKAMFGDHPYGSNPEGTLESVSQRSPARTSWRPGRRPWRRTGSMSARPETSLRRNWRACWTGCWATCPPPVRRSPKTLTCPPPPE